MGTLARFTYESLLHNRVDIVQDIMSEVADAIKRTMEEHDCKWIIGIILLKKSLVDLLGGKL